MGIVISLVRDAYRTANTVVKVLSTLNAQYKALIQRASSSPGVPVANPTSSYWLDDAPFPELVDIQHKLPEGADVVIIGSGITGAAAAKSLLELGGSGLSVVVLEARQLCSGATGRNGGHIKVVPYEVFSTLRERGLSAERAREMVRFQMRHLDVLMEVGGTIPAAEVREVETVDLFLEEKDFEKAKRQVRELEEWMPEVKCSVWEEDEARAKFGVNGFISGAISYKAGALWPYRLVTGVWNDLVKRYSSLVLRTHTPVEAITTDPSSSHPYTIKTSHGFVKARNVLHATNAFAPTLVPSLSGRLTGALAHMTAQRPGLSFPKTGGKRSWSVIYSPGFEYVTQRPDGADGAPGDLMIGGGFIRSKDQGMDQIGVWDDSRRDAFPTMHLWGSMGAVFQPNWGSGGEVKKAWTGILGFTGDTMPFVGRLPETKRLGAGSGSGQWIAAGFNGEGMVWTWLCGTAVAVMMLGRGDEELERGVGRPEGRLDRWFPVKELCVDKERLERADLKNLAGELM